jgi:hypothetical protein
MPLRVLTAFERDRAVDCRIAGYTYARGLTLYVGRPWESAGSIPEDPYFTAGRDSSVRLQPVNPTTVNPLIRAVTNHRDLPSSRAVCHSSVLSNQHSWGCVKFGTKRHTPSVNLSEDPSGTLKRA